MSGVPTLPLPCEMPPSIPSLHHVTATVAEAAPDLRFYTEVLGLRLVKKTVNFDNPGVYHLYYGNERGEPSTLMTTFPYAGRRVPAGVHGAGQITVTSFSVPPGALEFWDEHLSGRGLEVARPERRFGEGALMVEDPSGLNIELREGSGDDRKPWTPQGFRADVAVRGVHGVTLVVRDGARSVGFLTEALGLRVVDRDGRRTRLAAADGGPGSFLEVLESPHAPDARNGLGTVHHVALAVAGDDEQDEFRRRLLGRGTRVTPVRDRQYFRSIYFHEPGGILLELATVGPGFATDEPVAELGRELRLPPWEEKNRAGIEEALEPLPAPRTAPAPGEGR